MTEQEPASEDTGLVSQADGSDVAEERRAEQAATDSPAQPAEGIRVRSFLPGVVDETWIVR
ncbi:hypothetical protein SAMN04488564_11775 [Lentzea waywayandensis]|uniref:Uncharacterized protein n=1 Tax=Lentzea waywayandensis TaxID=84724 RepID=A0A1I6FGT5_9PSEU|nr:hypothetical protein SAMN04488564_11775 [Lentzea waywayandensis]